MKIGDIQARLKRATAHFSEEHGVMPESLPLFINLRHALERLNSQFNRSAALPTPPSQLILNALAKFCRGESITAKEWRYVCTGLNLPRGTSPCLLEDKVHFAVFLEELDHRLKNRLLKRRAFQGLLHSYFNPSSDQNPRQNPHWLELRNRLQAIIQDYQDQRHRPAWVGLLETHLELFTDQAGEQLGKMLLEGGYEDIAALEQQLGIPQQSWLWKHVVEKPILAACSQPDVDFWSHIAPLATLVSEHFPAYVNLALTHLLERYAISAYRREPHAELKQFALTHWDSPQLKTATHSRWSLVSESVVKMVQSWFAKADLEHFFKLLQGEGQVDQERLDYWLRFVEQISYTRIVMGDRAFNNKNIEYIEFRKKNAGRFSQLKSPNDQNNAFILQIGQYFFVEFSQKGNACYVYQVTNQPFNPETRLLTVNNLKSTFHALERIIHNGQWQYKADYQLARLGISPDIIT